MSVQDKRLLLVDGNNIFYRAYTACPELVHEGFPVQGIKGFHQTVSADIKTFRATHVLVCWDGAGITFRHKLYAAYKANRGNKEEDANSTRQMELCKLLCRALGWHTLTAKDTEADDLIASAATQFTGVVCIRSHDKDFAQLLSPTIRRLTSHGLIGPDEVFARYGVKVEQFIDYLCLTGDAADNIKGCEGVGPVKASKWLSQWGTIDRIDDFSQDLSDTDYRHFHEFYPRYPLNRQLITLKRDVEVPQNLAIGQRLADKMRTFTKTTGLHL